MSLNPLLAAPLLAGLQLAQSPLPEIPRTPFRTNPLSAGYGEFAASPDKVDAPGSQ
jgi:hypothetical protein